MRVRGETNGIITEFLQNNVIIRFLATRTATDLFFRDPSLARRGPRAAESVCILILLQSNFCNQNQCTYFVKRFKLSKKIIPLYCTSMSSNKLIF